MSHSFLKKSYDVEKVTKIIFDKFCENASWAQCYKTFLSVISKARVFVLGKPFQPSLMDAGKA
jgi:hypothetical protein